MKIKKLLAGARRKGWEATRLTLREVDEEKRVDEALKGFGERVKEKSDEALKGFLERLSQQIEGAIQKINEIGEGVIRRILEGGKRDEGKRPLAEVAKEQPQRELERVNPIKNMAEVRPNPLMESVRPQQGPLMEVAREQPPPGLARPQPKALEDVAQQRPQSELEKPEPRALTEVGQEKRQVEFEKPQPNPLMEVAKEQLMELVKPEPKVLSEIAKQQAQPTRLAEVVKEQVEPGLGKPEVKPLVEVAKQERQPEFEKVNPVQIMNLITPEREHPTIKRDLLEIKMGRVDESKMQGAAVAQREEKNGKVDFLEGEIKKINATLEGVKAELKERSVIEKPAQAEVMEKRPEKILDREFINKTNETDEIRRDVVEGFKDW